MTEEIALKEAEKPGIGFLSPYNHAEVWQAMFLVQEPAVNCQFSTNYCTFVNVCSKGNYYINNELLQ